MLTQGITQFQVKLGADANWEADVARLRLVREAVGDGPLVYGDWNCGATSLDAIRIGRAVRDLDIICLLYTSPSPRDGLLSRMPSSA